MAFFYPYYHIITIFGMVLVAMATPIHLTTQGGPVVPYIIWQLIWGLLNTVNGLVWHDHTENIAPIWCDICKPLSFPLRK